MDLDRSVQLGFPSAWAWNSFSPVWNSFSPAWNSFRARREGRPRRRFGPAGSKTTAARTASGPRGSSGLGVAKLRKKEPRALKSLARQQKQTPAPSRGIAADTRRQSFRPLKLRRLASARPRPYMDQALSDGCGDARGGAITVSRRGATEMKDHAKKKPSEKRAAEERRLDEAIEKCFRRAIRPLRRGPRPGGRNGHAPSARRRASRRGADDRRSWKR